MPGCLTPLLVNWTPLDGSLWGGGPAGRGGWWMSLMMLMDLGGFGGRGGRGGRLGDNGKAEWICCCSSKASDGWKGKSSLEPFSKELGLLGGTFGGSS